MKHKGSIIVVDKDEAICQSIEELLVQCGYRVVCCMTAGKALQRANENPCDLILSGLNLPDMNGLDLQEKFKTLHPVTGFIIMTFQGSFDSALQALKNGALDYLSKPLNDDLLRLSVERAMERIALKKDNMRIKRDIKEESNIKNLLGISPPMIEIYKTVARISESNATVLITGETGTGKELVARAIHFNSNRSDKPFIPINCEAIPQNLIETELFGHEKGAFTGAVSSKKGLFEEAAGGTVFLDEIGDISQALQIKLLRVLQEKEIRRIGGSRPIPINVRIVAATNRNIEEDALVGNFREDLFFRLSVVTITVPALRERRDDIPLLAEHFMEKYAAENESDIEDISDQAMEILKKYTWPGNVRELENAIDRAVIICKGTHITPDNLPERIMRSVQAAPENACGAQGAWFKKEERLMAFREVEKTYLQTALRETHGDKSKVAKLMGVSRSTLYRILERHDLFMGQQQNG